MKKPYTKIFAILLLLLAMTGCGEIANDEVVYTHNGATISESEAEELSEQTISPEDETDTSAEDTLPTPEIIPPDETNTAIVDIAFESFINEDRCSMPISKSFMVNSTPLMICYDFNYKSALFVGYSLGGELVHNTNLEDRPDFYSEASIPEEYRTVYSDMSGTGLDRGHLAPDASFDYDEDDLYVVYTMANIIPQDPNVNRYLWIKAEKYERYMATELGEVNVLNGVVFSDNPEIIGNGVSVPSGFWKMIWNDDENFKECYYYDNFVLLDVSEDELSDHLVDCNTLP